MEKVLKNMFQWICKNSHSLTPNLTLAANINKDQKIMNGKKGKQQYSNDRKSKTWKMFEKQKEQKRYWISEWKMKKIWKSKDENDTNMKFFVIWMASVYVCRMFITVGAQSKSYACAGLFAFHCVQWPFDSSDGGAKHCIHGEWAHATSLLQAGSHLTRWASYSFSKRDPSFLVGPHW